MGEVKEAQIFFVGSVITSLVGAVLMIATDFGAWYNKTQYIEANGWIEANFTTSTGLIIIFLIILFFICFIISIVALAKPDIIPSDNIYRIGFYLPLIILVLTIIGAIVFVVEMLDLDPTSWWFDASFYGALIGSLLTGIFFYLALQKMGISIIPKL